MSVSGSTKGTRAPAVAAQPLASVRTFSGSAALLQPMTLRQERALANDLAGPVCAFVAALVADEADRLRDDPHAAVAAVRATLREFRLDNEKEVRAVALALLEDMARNDDNRTTEARLTARLEVIFVNRARIFAGNTDSGEVDVTVPTATVFLRRTVLEAVRLLAQSARLLVYNPRADGARAEQRDKLCHDAVLRTLDHFQPPTGYTPGPPSAPAAAATAAPAVAKLKAPAKAAAHSAPKGTASSRSSFRDIGFDDEPDGEDDDMEDNGSGDDGEDNGSGDDNEDAEDAEEDAANASEGGDTVVADAGGLKLSAATRGPHAEPQRRGSTQPSQSKATHVVDDDTMSVLSAMPVRRSAAAAASRKTASKRSAR